MSKTKIDRVINLGECDLNIYKGRLGIICSGGADSSLLLYNLLKHTDTTVDVFTLANNGLDNKNVVAITNIINQCVKATDNHRVRHHVTHMQGNKPDGPRSIYETTKGYGLDYIYDGITRNPPPEILETMDTTVSPRDKNRDGDGTPNLEWVEELKCYSYAPWAKLTKKQLAKIYKDFNLLETLFPLTYSCEEYGLDTMDHCGKCWWCQERLWAFGRLV